MDYRERTGAGRGMRQTYWAGLFLILLAAGLNLAVAATAEFAPGALPMEAYVTYEESKSVITLTLAAMGLALVLRAALGQVGGGSRDAGPARFTPLTLRPRSGGIQLVTSRYLPTTGSALPGAAVAPIAAGSGSQGEADDEDYDDA